MSHLQTLVERAEELANRAGAENLFRNTLVNLREYQISFPDFTPIEADKANEVLAKFAPELVTANNRTCLKEIEKIYGAGETDTCKRCGAELTSKESRKRGYGKHCWTMVKFGLGEGDDGEATKPTEVKAEPPKKKGGRKTYDFPEAEP